MGFFDQIFGKDTSDGEQPNIRFGRYSDSYKTEAQYDAWDSALEKFDQKDYLGAYRDFLLYLRDDQEDNVHWTEDKGALSFEIFQGSKKIIGIVDHAKIRVEAKIVSAEKLDVAILNRLITRNYDLEYSRFALTEENCIVIVFDSFLLDGSPYKFYYALRELAINADKQDDLLIDEFEGMKPIAVDHLQSLPEPEKQAKYDFVQSKIKQVIDIMDDPQYEGNQYSGGITYLLLDLTYRLDFLVKPEGFMTETLERINRQYFSNDKRSIEEKNAIIRKELEGLLARPKDDFFKEMYKVPATFGITKPISPERIYGVIEGELPHMDWYRDHDHEAIALAIPGYIVGNCLFNYAVPKVMRDYFQLYYQIMEPEYFKYLGFKINYREPESSRFDQRSIKKRIRQIAAENRATYPRVEPDTQLLHYDSVSAFAKSYFIMLKELDLSG
jgi:hypothetical protein